MQSCLFLSIANQSLYTLPSHFLMPSLPFPLPRTRPSPLLLHPPSLPPFPPSLFYTIPFLPHCGNREREGGKEGGKEGGREGRREEENESEVACGRPLVQKGRGQEEDENKNVIMYSRPPSLPPFFPSFLPPSLHLPIRSKERTSPASAVKVIRCSSAAPRTSTVEPVCNKEGGREGGREGMGD